MDVRKWRSESEVVESCLTLCHSVDCSPPGFSVHGIIQARVLEWVGISFSRGYSLPRERTQVSRIAGRRFILWTTREAQYLWMWDLNHKEGWAPKNWCFWTVVLENTLESPLHCKEIKPVNPQFSSVQFIHSVVSDSLRPHELQHTTPPWSSPTLEVHSNSCPSSQWRHPAISSSVVPFTSCLQSLPASESFPMSQLFAWGGQSAGVSVLASVLPKKSQDWSLEWTGWTSWQSKGVSRVFSNTTVQKHKFFGAQLSSQSNSHIHTWLLKNYILD